jgi:hypothetical protein
MMGNAKYTRWNINILETSDLIKFLLSILVLFYYNRNICNNVINKEGLDDGYKLKVNYQF